LGGGGRGPGIAVTEGVGGEGDAQPLDMQKKETSVADILRHKGNKDGFMSSVMHWQKKKKQYHVGAHGKTSSKE
jgi:hypothetical protein